MVATRERHLGSGLYTVAEAAMYARVPTPLMSRWVFGAAKGKPVIEPEYGPEGRDVSFLDLVQTLAIREIRLQKNVPLTKFREAIKTARDTLGFSYPFARKHCTYLLGSELVIRPPGTADEYVEASGRHKGQRLFPFVEMYLDDLTYDPEGLANGYKIFQSRHPNPIAVRMDPDRRFGEPLLPSGYTPWALWKAIGVEGGIDRAAKAYGVGREEVETAYQFVVNHLNQIPG